MPYRASRSPQGTVVLVKPDGSKEYKFPVKTAGEARNAMARINQAKPALPLPIKKHVARAAQRKLGHSTDKIKQILAR